MEKRTVTKRQHSDQRAETATNESSTEQRENSVTHWLNFLCNGVYTQFSSSLLKTLPSMQKILKR